MTKYTREELMKMDKEQRNNISREIMDILDSIMYDDPDNRWDEVYAYHNLIESVIDDIYREENMESFRAYEQRMNEPDFDWDFYSDWHKDMFGYRPHKQVIPTSEAERQQIFTEFHAARGF